MLDKLRADLQKAKKDHDGKRKKYRTSLKAKADIEERLRKQCDEAHHAANLVVGIEKAINEIVKTSPPPKVVGSGAATADPAGAGA